MCCLSLSQLLEHKTIPDLFALRSTAKQMPYSGGSYIYLREAYGKDRWGRFMAYLFVFQFLFSAPIEIASGFIAMANYISYITGAAAGPVNGLIACGFCIISIMILYQDITCVGKTTLALWLGAIAAVVSTVVAGAMNFNPYNVAFPPPPLWPPSTPGSWAIFVYSLGTACRIGVYDFAGYSNACQMGGTAPSQPPNGAAVVNCRPLLIP